MAHRTYTDAEKAAALALYETEGPSAVQKQLGIPKQTVAGWARKAGTRTVRNEKMAEARQAADQDSSTLRALVAGKTATAANQMADLLIARLAVEGHEISLKDLATIFGIVVDKHGALVKMDQGNEEHSAVDAWLNHVMGGGAGKM